jgi:hypothetical protein
MMIIKHAQQLMIIIIVIVVVALQPALQPALQLLAVMSARRQCNLVSLSVSSRTEIT